MTTGSLAPTCVLVVDDTAATRDRLCALLVEQASVRVVSEFERVSELVRALGDEQ